ncbi:MAG: OmpH family outer membrane protein [Pseudomonadota bacterium]
MKKRKSIFGLGAAALMACGFFVGSGVAPVEAQADKKAPVILIVDRARLVGQSKAGKTIPDQAKSVQESVRKELEAEAGKLKSDIEKYQKNASLMSEEVRAKTEQELALRQRVSLPQQTQIVEQAFVAAVQNAEAKVLVESRPILKSIVESRGATILLDRSAVMYAAPETDITEEVIKKLDKKITKVDVEKISLTEIKKKIADAQSARQADAGKKK